MYERPRGKKNKILRYQQLFLILNIQTKKLTGSKLKEL